VSPWRHIGVADAAALIEAQRATVVDIRDPQSFAAGHIPGAHRLDNQNLAAFLAASDRTQPLIVCCYHGHSSQNAADFLAGQGYREVYSLDGGFEAWQYNHTVAR
jgi:thiosulfate sulfurtransferase